MQGFATAKLLGTGEQTSGAIFSTDRRYRYLLWRRWMPGPYLFVIGLNPSTADEKLDDPTMRRCIRFAKDWGYAGFVMGNLYGERSPDPDWIIEVLSNSDPIGPENDEYLRRAASDAGMILPAWGQHKAVKHRDRDIFVSELLTKSYPGKLHCLGYTQTGFPKHPLYVKAETRPIEFTGRQAKSTT